MLSNSLIFLMCDFKHSHKLEQIRPRSIILLLKLNSFIQSQGFPVNQIVTIETLLHLHRCDKLEFVCNTMRDNLCDIVEKQDQDVFISLGRIGPQQHSSEAGM